MSLFAIDTSQNLWNAYCFQIKSSNNLLQRCRTLVFSEYLILIRWFPNMSLPKYERHLLQLKRLVIILFNARHIICPCWLDLFIVLTLPAPHPSTSVTVFLLLGFFPERWALHPLAFCSSIPLPVIRKKTGLSPDVLILCIQCHVKPTS